MALSLDDLRGLEPMHQCITLACISNPIGGDLIGTTRWAGVLLPVDHGFPLRMYIPDVCGMKQPKWIESIEVTDHWEPGEHTFTVRCYDASATPQIVTPAPPEPTGASGLHSVRQRY